MKNKLRNLQGFKQGPAQSFAGSRFDSYSPAEQAKKWPNLVFKYGPMGEVKSYREKTALEKYGKIDNTLKSADKGTQAWRWRRNVGDNLENWMADAQENKFLTSSKDYFESGGQVFSEEDAEKLIKFIDYQNRQPQTAVSHIEGEGIEKDVKVTDCSSGWCITKSSLELPKVNIQVVNNASTNKQVTDNNESVPFYEQRRRR